jgi:hypothetical protein
VDELRKDRIFYHALSARRQASQLPFCILGDGNVERHRLKPLKTAASTILPL